MALISINEIEKHASQIDPLYGRDLDQCGRQKGALGFPVKVIGE
jgi:hypothetical protein